MSLNGMVGRHCTGKAGNFFFERGLENGSRVLYQYRCLFGLMVVLLVSCTPSERREHEGGYIRVVPESVDACDTAVVAAEVRWSVSPGRSTRVRIDVGQVGSESSKAFYVGRPNGTMRTGEWVRDGTIFVLTDDETGRFIDSLEVSSRRCI